MIITSGKFKFEVRPETLDEYVVHENAYSRKITVEPDDVWLDIGAHIGTFSVRFADQVRAIYAFEPDVTNHKLLVRNLHRNNITNVEVFRSALVGNDDVSRSFYINQKKNTGSHSFMVKRGRKEVTVLCTNINTVLRGYRPNKIKMDIEGAEYELIHAIEDWSGIEEIIFEFDFAKLKDRDHKMYFSTIKHLKKRGFRMEYNHDPKKSWHTVVVGRK